MTSDTRKRSTTAINFPRRRFVTWLAGIFVILTVALGIAPWYRQDWMLENTLVVVAALVLRAIYRHIPFSRLSWCLVFAFLYLHELGAHYTYSKVPYDAWFHTVTGHSLDSLLGWKRNNFDRGMHFLYGLLLAYPIREIFFRLVKVRGFWSYLLPLEIILSTSALYELLEWAAAAIFAGELGVAYVGTQGDPWDAQKDIVLAVGGALLAMTVAALVNRRYQRDFTRESTDSLRMDHTS
jgi:putative membrane protein